MKKYVTCSEKVSSRSVSIRPSGGRRYSLDRNVRFEPWEAGMEVETDKFTIIVRMQTINLPDGSLFYEDTM